MKGGINKLSNIYFNNLKLREVKPMKIERITVHGFRNIDNITLRFDNITALLSLNSFGKSNLLSAIDFGIKFIKKDSKSQMMRWIPGVPLNKKLAEEDFKFELEMTTDTNFWVIYGYQFKWVRNDDTGLRIVSEWLKVKKAEPGQKYSQYLIRDNVKAKFKKAESGRCNYPIGVESDELIINKLQAYDNLFFLDIVKKVNNLSVYIERHLDADKTYHPAPFIRTDLEALQIDNINNLPRAIFNIKEQRLDKYDLLINSYKQLFPQIEHIEVMRANFDGKIGVTFSEDVPLRIADEIYVLLVTDQNLNQPINFERMSDGAKRILLLLTCIILSDINGLSLVALEEPDNSIHPSLLGSLLMIIKQITTGCRILITSHSPYLIHFLDLSNLYIGLPSPDGVAKFSCIQASCKKALLRDAQENRQTTGDYIFDLMSGPQDEINELTKYLECDNE